LAEKELSAREIIQALRLEPLPGEGGLFRQSYLSGCEIPGQALPQRYDGKTHPCGTGIYYLLTDQPDSFSEFHCLLTDEVFHFYLGDPLEINLLFPDGSSQQVILGREILHGQQLQFTIPAGVWQGSCVAPGGKYTLIGTTMAPGYLQSDYTQGQREELSRQYPARRDWITRLTR
jgi:uncharacterized protein